MFIYDILLSQLLMLMLMLMLPGMMAAGAGA
jgi:hypothetical protein